MSDATVRFGSVERSPDGARPGAAGSRGTGLALALLISLAGAVSAEDPARFVGGNVQVGDEVGSGSQQLPAVAFNSRAREFLVVWSDSRVSSRNRDVFGQRLSALGVPIGENFRISGDAARGDEFAPAVAYNTQIDEYLVIWEDTRFSSIFGQRVSSFGTRLGNNFRVGGGPQPLEQRAPAIAFNGRSNEYLVVWEDTRNKPGRFTGGDIYAQRLSARGRRLGNSFFVGGFRGVEGDRNPEIAYNSRRNEYLVVWNETIPTQQIQGVLAQRISALGEFPEPPFVVRGEAAFKDVSVAYNPVDDEYLAVWDDGRFIQDGYDIFGQRISGAGRLLDVDFRISTSARDTEVQPAVLFNRAAGEYLAVWKDMRRVRGSQANIFGQRVSSAGERLGVNFRVNDRGADGEHDLPALAADPLTGGFLVVWTDGRDGGFLRDRIWGQFLILD